jgi:antitoxin (DNA-binding transcriptional repressor) of toxin-antitoxin stability system
MKRVSITELKNRLSHYLRLVKGGETIELLDRKVPVARLSGVARSDGDDEALLLRLQRDGVITSPPGKPYKRLLESPAVPCRADAVAILVQERGDR